MLHFFPKGDDICIRREEVIKLGNSEQTVERVNCAKNGLFEGVMILWLPRDILLARIGLVR